MPPSSLLKRRLYCSTAVCLFSCLVMSDSLQLHRLLPTSLLCPRDFPGCLYSQEYRVPFSSPEDLPDPRIDPDSCCLLHWQINSLPLAPPGKPTSISMCVWSIAAFRNYVSRVHNCNRDSDPHIPKHSPSCQLLTNLLLSNNCSNMAVNKTLQLYLSKSGCGILIRSF